MRSSEFIPENKKKSEVKKRLIAARPLHSTVAQNSKKDKIYDNIWTDKNKFSTDYILNLLAQEEK